jgi:hypothetical protein
MRDWAELLDSLRWNWGDAYLISFFEPEHWMAQRRDNRATLRAATPFGLRDLIIADYTARPVPRDLDRPATPSCRFPEG